MLLISVFVALVTRILQRQAPARYQSFLGNIAILLQSVLFTVLVLESALAIFYVQSDFFGFTYSANRWWKAYWHPVNAEGYRDEPFVDLPNKHKIVVLGDSIVAGQGVEDPKDRFTNILESKLGESFRVYNVAKCGWSTREQLVALDEVFKRVHPESVILSYYPNDIESVLKDRGMLPRLQLPQPHGAVLKATQFSALFSFAYWRYFRLVHADLGAQYWKLLEQQAASPDLWKIHEQDLEQIIRKVRGAGATLQVLLVPVLPAMDVGGGILAKVQTFFATHHVPVVKIEKALAGVSVELLIANDQDTHPSEYVHKVIAERLHEELVVVH